MKNYAEQIAVDKAASVEDRIGFLRYCAALYEHGQSPISDFDWDSEWYELKNLVPSNSFFADVGGSLKGTYGEALPHKIKMGSLSKVLCISEFKKWLEDTFNVNDGAQFLLMWKLDGASLSLVYSPIKNNGKSQLVQALSRGDGSEGINCLPNVMFIKSIPKEIPYDKEVEFRGEVLKDKSGFEQWKSMGYSNARNFVPGSLLQKDAAETGKRDLSFICWDVLRKDDFVFQQDKIQFMVEMGFQTLKDSSVLTKVGDSFDQIAKTAEKYMASINRQAIPYLIDGVVARLTNIKKSQQMGIVGNRPKSDRAIKYPAERKLTKLISVEPQVGRTGAVVPVGILEPVELGGAIIRRVTLHNYGSIVNDPDMKIGSIVEVAKQGDIIPGIIGVHQAGNKAFELPTVCPSCGTELEWDANKVHLVCSNYATCSAQVTSRVDHWLKTINVKGLGKGILDRLTSDDGIKWDDKPVVNLISDLYKLIGDQTPGKQEYLQDCFGDKAYQNIIDNVNSVKDVPLNIFVEALGIGKIGSMAKEITNIAPTVADIDRLTVNDLLAIPGFAETKSASFLNGWKAQRKEIDNLLKYITIKESTMASNKLAGKSFCFTGSFENPSRGEMEKMVPNNGGKLGSVSKNLTALVFDGASMKGKYEKSQKLGVPIITQDDFLKLLK